MIKRWLVILQKRPNSHSQDHLHLPCLAATLGCEVSLLLQGDAVWHILDSPRYWLNNTWVENSWHTLSLYDIGTVWVEAESLQAERIDIKQSRLAVKWHVVSRDFIHTHWCTYDRVITVK